MATQSSPIKSPNIPLAQPERTWQEIVEEASREHDPVKRQRLGEELERVLEKRAEKLRAQSAPKANCQSA